MVKIRDTKIESEIISVLNLFDKDFPRPISERVGNLVEYAGKLRNNAIFIISEYDFNVVGFAAMYANDSISRQAYLTLIAVSKEYFGKKIGKLLLSVCEERAKENGMRTMKLEVDKVNGHAVSFYEKNGYLKESANDLSYFMIKNL